MLGSRARGSSTRPPTGCGGWRDPVLGVGFELLRGALRRRGRQRRLGQQMPDTTGEVALERAQRALATLAIGLFAGQVLPGDGIPPGTGDRDRMQSPVELAIAAAVEPVLGALP